VFCQVCRCDPLNFLHWQHRAGHSVQIWLNMPATAILRIPPLPLRLVDPGGVQGPTPVHMRVQLAPGVQTNVTRESIDRMKKQTVALSVLMKKIVRVPFTQTKEVPVHVIASQATKVPAATAIEVPVKRLMEPVATVSNESFVEVPAKRATDRLCTVTQGNTIPVTTVRGFVRKKGFYRSSLQGFFTGQREKTSLVLNPLAKRKQAVSKDFNIRKVDSTAFQNMTVAQGFKQEQVEFVHLAKAAKSVPKVARQAAKKEKFELEFGFRRKSVFEEFSVESEESFIAVPLKRATQRLRNVRQEPTIPTGVIKFLLKNTGVQRVPAVVQEEYLYWRDQEPAKVEPRVTVLDPRVTVLGHQPARTVEDKPPSPTISALEHQPAGTLEDEPPEGFFHRTEMALFTDGADWDNWVQYFAYRNGREHSFFQHLHLLELGDLWEVFFREGVFCIAPDGVITSGSVDLARLEEIVHVEGLNSGPAWWEPAFGDCEIVEPAFAKQSLHFRQHPQVSFPPVCSRPLSSLEWIARLRMSWRMSLLRGVFTGLRRPSSPRGEIGIGGWTTSPTGMAETTPSFNTSFHLLGRHLLFQHLF
jgi:hypothetical protein